MAASFFLSVRIVNSTIVKARVTMLTTAPAAVLVKEDVLVNAVAPATLDTLANRRDWCGDTIVQSRRDCSCGFLAVTKARRHV